MDIHHIAVIGSGVMGSGIAALAANAGCEVTLLDIVPKDAENRNMLAENGIARQLASGGFTHPGNAKRVTAANLEDGLGALAKADWIIEAVLEKREVKQQVYRQVDAARKSGSVVSSNTSTLPLHELVQGMSEGFARDFMITHFFNPPRHMRLLEVVAGKNADRNAYGRICAFADEHLGKEVVECKDTPGFIANRIGIYWMVAGLVEAMRLGITVEEADAIMGRPVGIPKTGVFGLYDLIGIDLIPLIAKAMLDTLPPNDAFRALYREPNLVKKMIAEGYTGRKGKGGFYRVTKQNDKKIREVLDLTSGEYRPEAPPHIASARSKNINDLLAGKDKGAEYAWAVLSGTLSYAASLIPEISDSIAAVDSAMTNGYSWKYGVFALIDQIGVGEFAARLETEGKPVPPLLTKAKGRPLYHNTSGLTATGDYVEIRRVPGHLWLADVKRGREPIANNASASLWDMGEGIACLEFTSKMNAMDHNILALIEQALPRVQKDFRGLVIGNDTGQFCAGANLSVFLTHAKNEEWSAVSDLIERGQQAMLALRQAPFPVVASLAGLALGGGCEIVLHAQAIQAHIESTPGLVEVSVGLIPAWGGCKEMLLRHSDALKAFELIIAARTAGSAQEARSMHILRDSDGISMNRARVLADAKARCLQMAKAHQPLTPQTLNTGGATVKNAILHRLEQLGEEGKAGPHDLVIGRVLAHVLSGGETAGTISERQMLELEHEGFMELIRTTASQERIEKILA